MFFFFNDTATTEIYTLSLHDALPIWDSAHGRDRAAHQPWRKQEHGRDAHGDLSLPPVALRQARHSILPRLRGAEDRKSTRLNSSHQIISYAVFCLKKKKNIYTKELRF